MKITFYTRSGTSSPSSNFRILQYTQNLNPTSSKVFVRKMSSNYVYKKHTDSVGRFNKLFWNSIYYLMIQTRMVYYIIYDLLARTDGIVICRAISPKIILPINRILLQTLLSRNIEVIWDFDDDIFSSGEITDFEKELLLRKATRIIMTNKRLLDLLPSNLHGKVLFLPTTDVTFSNSNIQALIQERRGSYETQIELLWLATAPSIPNLDLVAYMLDRAAKQLKQQYKKELILNVVCNKPFIFTAKYLKIINVLWTRETSIEYTKKSHIGIMPLYDTCFNQKKGGFKLIQYMSAAMPTIGSAVGYNEDIIENGIDGFLVEDRIEQEQWIEYILLLSTNWDKYYDMSLSARKKWDKYFSYKDNLIIWENIILGERKKR